MFRRPLASLLLACVLPIGAASAVPITLQFTASGFMQAGAPDSTVHGTIKWEAATLNDSVQNFTSVDLTIAGHQYQLNEIAFAVDPNDANLFTIGGVVGGVFGLQGNTDDFAIGWLRGSSPAPVLFEYATTVSQSGGPFLSVSFDSFSVAADAANGARVPEPATGVLLGFALGGLVLIRLRSV